METYVIGLFYYKDNNNYIVYMYFVVALSPQIKMSIEDLKDRISSVVQSLDTLKVSLSDSQERIDNKYGELAQL